jgi:hypothetical protein
VSSQISRSDQHAHYLKYTSKPFVPCVRDSFKVYLNYFYYSFFSMSMNSLVDFFPKPSFEGGLPSLNKCSGINNVIDHSLQRSPYKHQSLWLLTFFCVSTFQLPFNFCLLTLLVCAVFPLSTFATSCLLLFPSLWWRISESNR